MEIGQLVFAFLVFSLISSASFFPLSSSLLFSIIISLRALLERKRKRVLAVLLPICSPILYVGMGIAGWKILVALHGQLLQLATPKCPPVRIPMEFLGAYELEDKTEHTWRTVRNTDVRE